MKRAVFLVGLPIVACVVSAIAVARVDARRNPLAPIAPAAAVEVEAKPPPAARHRDYVGVLVAPEAIDIAAKTDGQLAKLDVRVGQHVEAGRVVALLSSPVARQELRVAMVTHAAAADRLKRRQEAGPAILSSEELAQAKADYELSAARVEKARAALGECVLKAPFAGVIAARYVDRGSYVKTGTTIARLVASGGLRVRFAVPEADARSIATGSRVKAELKGDDRAVLARVDALSTEVEPSSRTIFAEASLETIDPSEEQLVGRLVRVSRVDSSAERSRP